MFGISPVHSVTAAGAPRAEYLGLKQRPQHGREPGTAGHSGPERTCPRRCPGDMPTTLSPTEDVPVLGRKAGKCVTGQGDCPVMCKIITETVTYLSLIKGQCELRCFEDECP